MDVNSYDDLEQICDHISEMQMRPEPACMCVYRTYNRLYETYVVRVGVGYEATDAISLPAELQQWVRESPFQFARPCTLDGMLIVDIVPDTRIDR